MNTATIQTAGIHPFRIDVPQADVDDLTQRLSRTRLPQPAPNDDWESGTPNGYLAEAVARWRDGFDWRAVEARMNEFPQFVTEIDGQSIHFVHVRSPHEGATPLLLATPTPARSSTTST